MRRRSERQSLAIVGGVALVGAVVVGVIAWQQAGGTSPEVEEPPAPESSPWVPSSENPEGLVGYFLAEDLRQWFGDVKRSGGSAWTDTVFPAGLDSVPALLGESFSAPEILGIDYGKPLFVALLSSGEFRVPLVLAGHVEDWAQLKSSVHSRFVERVGDRVLLGSKPARERVRGFAADRLANPPERAFFHVEFEEFLSSPTGKDLMSNLRSIGANRDTGTATETFIEGALQVQSVELSIEMAPAHAMRIDLVGAPGSGLAEFIGAQSVSSFSYASRLPPTPSTVQCAGTVNWLDATWMTFEGAVGLAFSRSDPATRSHTETAMGGLLGDEFAFSLDMTSGERRGVVVAQLADGSEGRARIENWFRWLGQQPSFIVVRPAPKHKRTVEGRQVRDYIVTGDESLAPDGLEEGVAETFAYGSRRVSWTIDRDALVAAGQTGGQDLIERMLSSAAPRQTATWTSTVQRARETGDSAVCQIDTQLFLGVPGHYAAYVRFGGGAITFRFQAPELEQ